MALRRVIAYPMHEYEYGAVADAAERSLSVTEAFHVAMMDDAQIAQLRAQHIVVEELDDESFAQPVSVARRSINPAGVVQTAPPPSEPPPPGDVANWRITLHTPLVEEVRDVIHATGGEVLQAIGRFTYLVVGPTGTADALIARPDVREVALFGGDDAATVPLRSTTTADEATEPGVWNVVTAGERWTSRVATWLSERGAVPTVTSAMTIELHAAADDPVLGDLLNQPGVVSVVEQIEPTLHLDRLRGLVAVDRCQIGAAGPYDGTGQIVAVADTGVDLDHPDLATQVVLATAPNPRGIATDPDGHGTHVAGIIAGTGAQSAGSYTGVAPGARLIVQSLYGSPAAPLAGLPADVGTLLDAAYSRGARVHNDSWGAMVQGAYDARAVQIDDYIDQHPDLVVVVAAGNEGTAASPRIAAPGFTDYYSVTSPATAKNAITVGASRSDRQTTDTHRTRWPLNFPSPPISAELISGNPDCMAGFSSRGPCDDERIKPDLVAPGTCVTAARSSLAPDTSFEAVVGTGYAVMSGTSMAAPVVAGAAAIVRQFYVVGCGHDPSAALVKATLINGTRWLTGPDAVAGGGVPNADQGFGCLDLSGALPADGRQLSFIDTTSTGQWAQYAFGRTGDRRRWQIDVATPGLPLRITLAWTDRPARLVQQDLGLLVERPDGTKAIGNEARAHRKYDTDVTNTVETVVIDAAPAGAYLVNVLARSLAMTDRPQTYAVVVTGAITGPLVPRANY